MRSRSASTRFIWIIVYVVLADLCSANQVHDAVEYAKTGSTLERRIRKRDTGGDECVLPPPLENGKFYPSARRCPAEDSSPACQMIPGTPVPRDWVIFFYCDAGFTLNTTKPVSVCLNGHWRPKLPICEVGAAECTVQDECPDNKTCIVGKCSDSCDGLCGPNTDCEVSAHRPLCNCKKGYVGNPFRGCILGDPVSLKLLLTQSTQVSVLDLTSQKIVSVLHYTHQNPTENSPSVAYHYERKYVFYSGPNQIFSVVVMSNQKRTSSGVVAPGVGVNAKLAVDWMNNKFCGIYHKDEMLEVKDPQLNN